MTMQPDSWRASISVASCFTEADEEQPAVGGLWCNYEDQDQTSAVYSSWDDETDSLRLSGATQWGDVYSYDSPMSFCRHDGTGDETHYGIECWVDCGPTDFCESQHYQMTVFQGTAVVNGEAQDAT